MADGKPERVAPGVSLVECDRWATMQWLPAGVVERLVQHRHQLARSGIRVHRSDVVAALVLDWNVCEPEGLRDSVRRYRATFTHPGTRRTDGAVPVTLRLPSPLSRRIDGLVELARKKEVITYRHDLVGMVIVGRHSRKSIAAAWERYRSAAARDAAVPGLSSGYVLEAVLPSPGPRAVRA